jgi:hypothetical protein
MYTNETEVQPVERNAILGKCVCGEREREKRRERVRKGGGGGRGFRERDRRERERSNHAVDSAIMRLGV